MMMGADLARARAGKKTKTGMTEKQLEEYASTPRKGLPVKAKAKPVAKGKAPMHKMDGHMMKDSEMRKMMGEKPKPKPKKRKK